MEAPDHDISWTDPDAELHSYMNEMESSAQLSLFGRRLYELMESYWDAAIIEAARSLGCETVLSEDLSNGQDYDGVRVANPFAVSTGSEGER